MMDEGRKSEFTTPGHLKECMFNHQMKHKDFIKIKNAANISIKSKSSSLLNRKFHPFLQNHAGSDFKLSKGNRSLLKVNELNLDLV